MRKALDKQPQAYRDGWVDFYGRKFVVTPDVLIPRPETEQLVDAVLALAGKPYLAGLKMEPAVLSDRPLICDVGTGSGCIAITIALEIPKAKVYAVDISETALKVAKQNAKKLRTEIDWYQSDLLGQIPPEVITKTEVFVANLPYVDKKWNWLDKEALAYEPELALYAGEGGLAIIRRLMRQIAEIKKRQIAEIKKQRDTYLLIEADPCQHAQLIKDAAKEGWRHEMTSGFGLRFMYVG